MPIVLLLDEQKRDLVRELLSTYISNSTTSNQCQVCGAYQSDHTHIDCPVKIASEIIEELE